VRINDNYSNKKVGNITSKAFFQAWLETVNNERRKSYLLENWTNLQTYTNHIMGDDDSVMKEVAKKLNLLCYDYNYYHSDTILYKEEDLVEDRPTNTTWLRDMRVVFEHEHNFNSGLFQEVSHLLILNSDIKVLVTYPDGDGNGNAKAELAFLHRVIKGNRLSKEISDNESFLIIFGYKENYKWKGFVFKEGDGDWGEIN
jgi:hypothetical protein